MLTISAGLRGKETLKLRFSSGVETPGLEKQGSSWFEMLVFARMVREEEA